MKKHTPQPHNVTKAETPKKGVGKDSLGRSTKSEGLEVKRKGAEVYVR